MSRVRVAGRFERSSRRTGCNTELCTAARPPADARERAGLALSQLNSQKGVKEGLNVSTANGRRAACDVEPVTPTGVRGKIRVRFRLLRGRASDPNLRAELYEPPQPTRQGQPYSRHFTLELVFCGSDVRSLLVFWVSSTT